MRTSNEWMQKAGELEHEIDRLQRELSEAQLRALKAEAEVERLHKQIVEDAFIAATNMQAAMRESDARQAEVERLRNENADLLAAERVLIAVNNRLHRIEEAARAFVNDGQGKTKAALRAALEQK